MNFERELDFFCEVLQKCHIHTARVSPEDDIFKTMDPRLADIIGERSSQTVRQVLGELKKSTKYKLRDEFDLRYICIPVRDSANGEILFIGPYLSSQPTPSDVWEIGERQGISPGAQRLFSEFYFSLPIIADGDRILTLVDSLCELVWQGSAISTVELNESYRVPVINIEGGNKGESFDEISAGIKLLEDRYSFENELIRAVSTGQIHKENLFTSAMSDQMLEKRAADPVRNTKNYCIIMNTLLRKAAEQGGVHPVYIDRMSSQLASRIELISDVKSFAPFMKEIFTSYCRLVYKHSMKSYSSLVKKTLLVIDSDISSELSLNGLAKKQGVSAGYLATVFKRETGKTVSEYIKDKRIDYATYLLRTTHLQIQTVALHCGIMDVQYFSKMFKKKIGKTPKEYREASRDNKKV